MSEDIIQDIRDRLTKIETLLENSQKNDDLKNELLEEKIKVANNRIADLENSNTWIWRAIAGALISSVIAFLVK